MQINKKCFNSTHMHAQYLVKRKLLESLQKSQKIPNQRLNWMSAAVATHLINPHNIYCSIFTMKFAF